MMDFERMMLMNALIENLPASSGVVAIYREDVDKIEPLIDDMVKRAEARGRIEAYLELLHRHAQRTPLTPSPDKG